MQHMERVEQPPTDAYPLELECSLLTGFSLQASHDKASYVRETMYVGARARILFD